MFSKKISSICSPSIDELPISFSLNCTGLQLALSDIELWNSFVAGDKEAFSTLFRRFYPLLFQYGSKIISNEVIVEDAIQELFTEIWQKPTQQPLQSVKAYLLQALKFKLYKTFRDQKRTTTEDEAENYTFELSQETLHIAREESDEQRKKIDAALAQLSPRQKEVIYLKIYKGLSYEEVSEIMGINYQVVRNLLCTALKAFKKLCSLLAIILLSSTY
ncbi:MAG: sigma-70 family RNA polymerase sigma factor [Chitinophagaceae bacterium]|nr:MAG: sigma-70 family RNA polymerase sigma factor [Chitinophagaceae bacterium]